METKTLKIIGGAILTTAILAVLKIRKNHKEKKRIEELKKRDFRFLTFKEFFEENFTTTRKYNDLVNIRKKLESWKKSYPIPREVLAWAEAGLLDKEKLKLGPNVTALDFVEFLRINESERFRKQNVIFLAKTTTPDGEFAYFAYDPKHVYDEEYKNSEEKLSLVTANEETGEIKFIKRVGRVNLYQSLLSLWDYVPTP